MSRSEEEQRQPSLLGQEDDKWCVLQSWRPRSVQSCPPQLNIAEVPMQLPKLRWTPPRLSALILTLAHCDAIPSMCSLRSSPCCAGHQCHG